MNLRIFFSSMYCIVHKNRLPLQRNYKTEAMVDNIKTQMRKGILEYCILGVIFKSDEAYVSDILKVLKDANLFVVEGTVYPLLTRMKNAGLLTYRWQESQGGPPRKYYKLTEEGHQLYESLEQEWAAISGSVEKVTSNK